MYDLSFDHTRARLYDSALSIEYVRTNGAVPVRVVVRRPRDGELTTGAYDLVERGDVVGESGSTELPPLKSGRAVLNSFDPREGARVAGRIEARLKARESVVGLRGHFETSLRVIDRVGGYPFDAGRVGNGGVDAAAPDVGDAAADGRGGETGQ
ncbi:MAG: hypothetical protein ABEL76_09210 [Bradymonadaceae bacterium]